ncbi:MAG: BRO family protein [Amaricoccus sp.]|uniref:BRO family protein n=1 Tax=Amaricoccus sp. TaxID=1872485 RepID=UPI0039E367FE
MRCSLRLRLRLALRRRARNERRQLLRRHDQPLWIDGEPWFPVKDVLRDLGIGKGAAWFLEDRLEPKSHRVLSKAEMTVENRRALSRARLREASIIIMDEAGLYMAILYSWKPEARPFQEWMLSVADSIETTGGYVVGQETLSPQGQAKLAPWCSAAAAEIIAKETTE